MFIASRSSALNLVVLLRLEGSSIEEGLPVVLARMQRRHPFLRARVTGSDLRPRFEVGDVDSSDVQPVPCRVLPAGDAGIRSVIEAEMNLRFDEASAPLARVTYVCSPGSTAWLVLTLFHCICDGVAAGSLVSELLEGCRLELEGGASERVVSLPVPPPVIDLLPAGERGLAGVGRRLAFAGHELVEELRYRRGSGGAGRVPSPGRARTRMFSLTQGETNKLVAWCRREGVTLTNLLNAALLSEASRRGASAGASSMRALVWVDLRPHLTPPPSSETLACYVSMLRVVLPVDRRQSLASLGRQVQELTAERLRRGDRLSAAILSSGATWAMERSSSMRLGTTALSYAGADPVAQRYGSIEVPEVRAFVPDNPRGAELAAVAGLRLGALWCNLLYLDSEMDEEEAGSVEEGLRATLAGAGRL